MNYFYFFTELFAQSGVRRADTAAIEVRVGRSGHKWQIKPAWIDFVRWEASGYRVQSDSSSAGIEMQPPLKSESAHVITGHESSDGGDGHLEDGKILNRSKNPCLVRV